MIRGHRHGESPMGTRLLCLSIGAIPQAPHAEATWR